MKSSATKTKPQSKSKGFMARQRNEAIKTLSDIARLLQSPKREDNPLQSITRLVRRSMDADVCSLYLLQDNELLLVATDGLDPGAVGQVKMPLDKGLTGLIAQKSKPVITNNAQAHPRYEYFPATREERFNSFAGVPIIDGEKIVGVLNIQSKKSGEYSEETTDLLAVISFQLSNVIQNLVNLEIFRQKKLPKYKAQTSKLQGLGTSPGITVGSAVIIENEWNMLAPANKKSDPEVEKKRLKKALRDASNDLKKLEDQLLKKLSRQESDIFNAHRLILKDKSFQQRLDKEISKKRSAEVAVLNVMNEYAKTFTKIADPYIRDRVVDLEDLAERIINKLSGDKPKNALDLEGILIAERLTPSETVRLNPDKIKGIVTMHGGQASHAAILARSLGIPAIMGIPEAAFKYIKPNQPVIVDGNSGELYINPPNDVLQEYEKLQQQYANRLMKLNPLADQETVTKDGRKLHLDANVGLVDSLQYIKNFGAEGVGLYRTEIPFMVRDELPNENQQYRVYRQILEAANGLPVTFRTLDAGGDKPVSYLHLDDGNSFLGYRSIRLCLSEPKILKTQLKALYRAASHGPMRILFPMISGLEELREVKRLIHEVKRDLRKRKEKITIPDVPIGIMIEVPSAVQLAHILIKEVDFFSIGTNDLIQFTLAVDRNNEKVADFFEPFHPAVIHSLWQVVQAAHKEGKWVSICGEMAGDPNLTALLVGLGFDRLSMIPTNIPVVKRAIQGLYYKKLLKDVKDILEMPTAHAIKRRLNRYQPKTS